MTTVWLNNIICIHVKPMLLILCHRYIWYLIARSWHACYIVHSKTLILQLHCTSLCKPLMKYFKKKDIYFSGNAQTLTLILHPATGDNVDLQYVRLTLQFTLPDNVSINQWLSCHLDFIFMPYYGLFFTWSPYSDLRCRLQLWAILLFFYWDYPYEHYFYVPWLIMTSHWVMTLLGISIVMSEWVMTLQCVHIMLPQCTISLLWASFIVYYYAQLWYCSFSWKLFKLVHNTSQAIFNQ